jgi:2,3-bisphosphoglycerate-independent phosphoglycerate mutase
MNVNVPKPLVLLILDGWGLAPASASNAITQAKTPNITQYWHSYPHTELAAAEEAVGLPKGEDGNSETGHLNIGAGYVVLQSLTRINNSINDGSFFTNPVLATLKQHLQKNNSCLHILGLVGPAGVHSSLEHLYALLNWAKQQQLIKVYLHLFTDGRDSPPYSSLEWLSLVEEKIKSLGVGQIATVMGRFYAMDRDNRWERVKLAYEAITEAKGDLVDSYVATITKLHEQKISDEFIKPLIIKDKSGQPVVVNDNDAVIFFNFRTDRPRELTKAFVLPNFDKVGFVRSKILKNIFFATMTAYEKELPVAYLYTPDEVQSPLAQILSDRGLRQLHMAETEKAPHVTFYFDGKREKPFDREDWLIVPSPKIKTYDLKPEMSAYEITSQLLQKLSTIPYDFVVVNFANPDMVGHTGVLAAAIKACEVVDECVGKIVNHVADIGGVCLIVGDHGNVEEMINQKTGVMNTKHSTNKVPFIVVGKQFTNSNINLATGQLSDIAPTVLKMLNVPKPDTMTGRSLL